MSTAKAVKLNGVLRLEGPFLESIVAAWLISKGENVVRRPCTGDVQHDVLTERYDGFVFYECTGLENIGIGKVDRFYTDALKLCDELKRRYNRPLREAWFVSANTDNSWQPGSREALQEVAALIQKRIGATVKVLSSDELLLELLGSGVLGLRYAHDRIYWAGPEDVAVRYDPAERRFVFDRCDRRILDKFSRTHFSLLPSAYWDSYYRHVFEEVAAEKQELPLSVFSYYPQEGAQFGSIEDLVELYSEHIRSFRSGYVLEKTANYLLGGYESNRGNRYYTLNMFTLGEKRSSGCFYVSKQLLHALLGEAYRVLDKLKRENRVPQDEKVAIRIISATQHWSPLAWGLVPEFPSAYREEVSSQQLISGNELLMDLLNRGVLGFKIEEKNRIVCVGPGVPSIRMKWLGDRFDLGIADKPIFA